MTTPVDIQYRTLPVHSVVTNLPAAAQVLLATLLAWPRKTLATHDAIGKELSWSSRKVQRYMRVLRETGIIRADQGRRGNTYTILSVERWGR